MNYTRGAVMLGQRPRFQQFLSVLTDQPINTAEQAANAVRQYCMVASRKELNTNAAAGEKYQTLIRLFNHWMNGGALNQESRA